MCLSWILSRPTPISHMIWNMQSMQDDQQIQIVLVTICLVIFGVHINIFVHEWQLKFLCSASGCIGLFNHVDCWVHNWADSPMSFEHMLVLRATSHTRLRAHNQCTSSTLIGGNGTAGPSSLHTLLEGPMEYVNALMDVKSTWIFYMASNGSCFMAIWTMFKNHLLEYCSGRCLDIIMARS